MKRSNESAIVAASSNSSSCKGQPNQVDHFNPAPTFIDQHPASKGVSVTGCYWPDGSPADGGARGVEESFDPFDALYPCLDPDKTYSPDESIVCCWSGDVCFGEAKLCGIPAHEDSDKTKGAFSAMYRGGCTAQPDTWADAAGCPQKCLDPSRPFENILDAEVMVVACDDPSRADNLTLYCSNDGIDPTRCDHNGAALDGYGQDEAWGMMETLQIHGVALSTVTSIPIATSSSASQISTTSSESSTTSTTAVMGTPPSNVTAPNSPNTTTIILAVGIPLGLLFFFGMLAVAFICHRRRNAPQPEEKRRSFTVLNVNHSTAQPDDTNSLGTPYSERNVLPGPLSSNPILPFSPSDPNLPATTGTSEIPQKIQKIDRTPTPHPESDLQDSPDHPRRTSSSTPTPWPVSPPFLHTYTINNQNLPSSNRNSYASGGGSSSLRKSHTEGDLPLIIPDNHHHHHRQSHQSTTSSTIPFPSYSEPNISYPSTSPRTGPQFPFYSREVHEALQQMEYDRELQNYYAAAASDHHHGFSSHNPIELPGNRATSLPAPTGGSPSTRMYYTYGYGRPAVGVGRPQVVQIGSSSRGGSQQRQSHERGGSTGTVRNVGFDSSGGRAGEGVGHARQQGVGAGAGVGSAGASRGGGGSGNGSGYLSYRSSA
ncbi:hypothetical protein QBC40DRAFT_162580 [Triangularia verruculosa]|uniref:Uncharacterized protein n=1 Tax=Triangularia verruculosa TaxID=2587418 RepID=A0AAN6XRY9_9PEZI|nr:hypothetical protein QBC40DRAFT_162580 [Triangularia verruculosa]